MCRSAVNDGSCSPWVMCSCSVVRGNQIRESYLSAVVYGSIKFFCRDCEKCHHYVIHAASEVSIVTQIIILRENWIINHEIIKSIIKP